MGRSAETTLLEARLVSQFNPQHHQISPSSQDEVADHYRALSAFKAVAVYPRVGVGYYELAHRIVIAFFGRCPFEAHRVYFCPSLQLANVSLPPLAMGDRPGLATNRKTNIGGI
jgi:hypothetical protein